jgi:TolB-like protein
MQDPAERRLSLWTGDRRSADAASDADIRRQLDKILGHSAFDASDRMRAFLAYVVEEALAGRGDRIKAFSIAQDVFGRDASFDAHSDPLVRVEAGHLRRSLERYYLTAGGTDPIVLEIPKGSYVPKFTIRRPSSSATSSPGRVSLRRAILSASAAAAVLGLAGWSYLQFAVPPPARPDLPRIVVVPFTNSDKETKTELLSKGLTNEVLTQLARFKDLVVIDGTHASQHPAAQARYLLEGDVTLAGEKIRMLARVVDQSDGDVLWSDRYEEDLSVSKVLEIQLDIARMVGASLGQPYGVIHQADLSRRTTPDDWTAYACTLAYYTYRVQLDAQTHPKIRQCLEGAVAQFPAYATAWALLSQVYLDEVRLHYAASADATKPSLDRALEAATKASQLDPDNVRALQAEMLALFFTGRHEAALTIGRRAIAQNPNDMELAGEFGFRAAAAGDWEVGCSLLEGARERNPGPLGYFEVGFAICAYIRGDFAKATMWIQKTPMLENHIYHLYAAAIYAEAGLTSLCEKERDWLMTHAPKILANIRQEMAVRYVRAEDRQRFMQSFRKAGLPVPED